MSIAVAMFLIAAGGQAASAGADSQEASICGAWQLESKTQKGVETKIDAKGDDASNTQTIVLTFEEQSWKAKVGGAAVELKGAYALDRDQTPKLLDITITQGDSEVTDAHAVYKIEHDRLYIRVRADGGQRPPDFHVPDDESVMFIFHRVKT
jgi:uncharacterized protein (TIGR03067 family)